MSQAPRFLIFAHNATYDKLHQVATLGLTAAAMGKDVIVVLLFWTIKKLAEGRLNELDFPPEYQDQAPEVAKADQGTKGSSYHRYVRGSEKGGSVSIGRVQCRARIHGGGF